jgi:hypothetical protein
MSVSRVKEFRLWIQNFKEIIKTSEQDAAKIAATDTNTDANKKVSAEELKISGEVLGIKIYADSS